jgi:hypothetical protein
MIDEIIFFILAPLCTRDYKRFGVEILLNNGFKVRFLNISPYINPKLFQKSDKNQTFKSITKKNLYSKLETKREIEKISKNSFIVMMVPCYNYEIYHVFRYISKKNIPYALPILSSVPVQIKVLDKLKKLRFDSLIGAILNRIFSPLNGKFMGVLPPNVVLLGGRISLSHQLLLLSNKKTKKLWVHSFDYDVYLRDKDNKNETDDEIITFIDAPSPRFKFDSLIKGISSPLTESVYYPALCHFFEILEREYKGRVSIASHPKSEHVYRPSYFDYRQTYKEATITMIRKSKVIVNRNSTSVNFAILYNKPVIFHTSDEIENSLDQTMSSQIKSMASALNKTPVNINNLKNINWIKELSIDNSSFNKYKDLYIKKEGSRNVYIWQEFSNWIRGEF